MLGKKMNMNNVKQKKKKEKNTSGTQMKNFHIRSTLAMGVYT